MKALLFAAVVALASAGCDSRPPLDPLATSSANTNQPTTLTQASATGECDRPAGNRLMFSSFAEMQKTIRGTWQLCTDVGLFHQPQHGMYIGPDDRYVFLDLVGGKLVPKTGLENEGHLEYFDPFQVYFVSAVHSNPSAVNVIASPMYDGETYIIAAPPIFSDDPRFLFINNEGVETYRYGAVK